jgi:hypothetical protein
MSLLNISNIELSRIVILSGIAFYIYAQPYAAALSVFIALLLLGNIKIPNVRMTIFLLSIAIYSIIILQDLSYALTDDLLQRMTMLNIMVYASFIYIYNTKDKISLVNSSIFLVGMYGLLVVVYSIYLDRSMYGAGNLYDPFRDNEINSPLIATQLALFSSYLMYRVFSSINIYILILLITTIASGFYLGSRTFFLINVVSFVSCLYHFKNSINVKTYISVSVLSIISILVVLFSQYGEPIMQKFSDNSIQSGRYIILLDALSNVKNLTLSGHFLEHGGIKSYWYHNHYLDSYRIGGIIPLLLMISITLYGFKSIYFSASSNFYVKYLNIIVFLLLVQDIILEGLIVLLFIHILLIYPYEK